MVDSTDHDSTRYSQRKAFFERMLTVYGRKPVLEALLDPALTCHALHLADSNREASPVRDILRAAEQRGIPVHRHNRAELARISRNGRQDQGVAVDILCPGFRQLADYLAASRPLPNSACWHWTGLPIHKIWG